MNKLALFAGAGGGILASKLLGWNTVCGVEVERYPREVLLQRQRDGILEPFPIWDDIRTFDGKSWRGKIDIVTGGFPCKDISIAGKGRGITGEHSGLWFEMLRVIDEVRPRFVFAENSPNLRTRGLGSVIEGLASLGYDLRWCVLGAWHIGANHKRNRMWVLAYPNAKRLQGQRKESGGTEEELQNACNPCWWSVEPNVGRVAHGVASRVDRIKALGNGQVPAVAKAAWEILTEGIENES